MPIDHVDKRIVPEKVNIIGAFERFNLGDILFAKVAQDYFEDITFSSLGSADLSSVGGVATNKLSLSLQESIPNIFIGGEIFGLDSFDGRIQTKESKDELLSRLIYLSKESLVVKRIAKVTRQDFYNNPYFQNFDSVPDHRSALVATGGSNASWQLKFGHKGLAGVLSTFQYLSVRDNATKETFNQSGLFPNLAPDLVSTIKFEKFKTNNFTGHEYVVLQFSSQWWRKNRGERSLLLELIKFIQSTGLKVIFVPFGYSDSHSDQSAFAELSKHNPHVELQREVDLATKIDLLSSAKLFVGSSLHGQILSVAACIPSIILGPTTKVENYKATWFPRIPTLSSEIHNPSFLVRTALTNLRYVSDLAPKLSFLAKQNLARAVSALGMEGQLESID